MSWYTVKESHENGEYRVRYEFDLLARAMEVLEAQHAEMGDRAFEVVLAEMGYVKRGACKLSRGTSGLMHVTTGHCSECGAEVVKGTKDGYRSRYCQWCGAKVVS